MFIYEYVCVCVYVSKLCEFFFNNIIYICFKNLFFKLINFYVIEFELMWQIIGNNYQFFFIITIHYYFFFIIFFLSILLQFFFFFHFIDHSDMWTLKNEGKLSCVIFFLLIWIVNFFFFDFFFFNLHNFYFLCFSCLHYSLQSCVLDFLNEGENTYENCSFPFTIYFFFFFYFILLLFRFKLIVQ